MTILILTSKAVFAVAVTIGFCALLWALEKQGDPEPRREPEEEPEEEPEDFEEDFDGEPEAASGSSGPPERTA